jgi:hypothetical protein
MCWVWPSEEMPPLACAEGSVEGRDRTGTYPFRKGDGAGPARLGTGAGSDVCLYFTSQDHLKELMALGATGRSIAPRISTRKPNRRVSTKAHDEFRVKYLQQPRHQGLQFGEFPDAQKAKRPGQLLRNPRLHVLSSRITQFRKS